MISKPSWTKPPRYGSTPLCMGKAGYDDATEAREARNRRLLYERMRLYAYKCQHHECPYWHLTKKKPPPEQMR